MYIADTYKKNYDIMSKEIINIYDLEYVIRMDFSEQHPCNNTKRKKRIKSLWKELR